MVKQEYGPYNFNGAVLIIKNMGLHRNGQYISLDETRTNASKYIESIDRNEHQ